MLSKIATLSLTVLLVSAASAQNAPTISYTYPGSVPKDTALVSDALSKLTLAKIGVRVKLEPVDWGAYDQRRSLANAAGEKCDVVFTASWTNDYNRNVAQGNLLALDTLLPKYAPGLYKSFVPSTWNAARVDGKIYGAINQQAFPAFWGVLTTQDLAQKYKLDFSKVRRYEDLEPFLAQIKKGEKGVTPVYLDNTPNNTLYHPIQLGWDAVTPADLVTVRYNDAALKAFNPFATSEFKRIVTLARKWNQLGYFPSDLPSQSDGDAQYKAGKYAVRLDQWRPDTRSQSLNRFGLNVIGKSLTRPILTTGAITGTMNAVCRTSPNPEAAVKFLELLNTDKEVYNVLSKGIEGKHWTFKDKAQGVIGLPEGVTSETSTYNPGTDWMFGNSFNAYGPNANFLQEARASAGANRSSKPSQALGFSFDPEPVKSEVAQLSAVVKEYAQPLIWGQVDPAKGLPELQQRLKAAGMDRLLAETQKQLNAWKRQNP